MKTAEFDSILSDCRKTMLLALAASRRRLRADEVLQRSRAENTTRLNRALARSNFGRMPSVSCYGLGASGRICNYFDLLRTPRGSVRRSSFAQRNIDLSELRQYSFSQPEHSRVKRTAHSGIKQGGRPFCVRSASRSIFKRRVEWIISRHSEDFPSDHGHDRRQLPLRSERET